MPTLASAGIVVSVLLDPSGVVRMPSTAICPPAGVSNSIVPRRFAVTGYCVDTTKEVWPFPASAIVVPAVLITAPVSSRITIGITAASADTFSTATPSTTPPVLSKANK